ncbi:hypothetical protein BaRGS_00011031, partial [Batillaria attramentaria]
SHGTQRDLTPVNKLMQKHHAAFYERSGEDIRTHATRMQTRTIYSAVTKKTAALGVNYGHAALTQKR